MTLLWETNIFSLKFMTFLWTYNVIQKARKYVKFYQVLKSGGQRLQLNSKTIFIVTSLGVWKSGDNLINEHIGVHNDMHEYQNISYKKKENLIQISLEHYPHI